MHPLDTAALVEVQNTETEVISMENGMQVFPQQEAEFVRDQCH